MPIFVVRVFDASGSGFVSDIVTGMYECDDAGANVVNMSLGSGPSSSYQTALNSILAGRDDILFVASAGNDGDSSYGYPASYSEFVSVGSVTSSKVRSSFSQYNDQVDLVGPGSSVYSTTPGNSYGYKSGTSMASPHVAGVAALVWSHFPTLTAAEIRSALIASAEDLGPDGRDDEYGYGLVDAQEAYKYLAPMTCPDYSWTPISGEADAVRLGTSTDYTDLIDLGFKFYWLGGYSYTEQVVVSHNGQININTDDTSSNCCIADPIGDYDKPRIAVIQEDLDGGSDELWDVWMMQYPGEVLISWESSTFSLESGYVNAQARLLANGGVVICYGSGDLDGNSFAAGIEGREDDNLWAWFYSPVAYPLPGSPFNSDGIASAWPTGGSCYCFDPDSASWDTFLGPTSAPTPLPTVSPSVSPTTSPSLSPTVTCTDSGFAMAFPGSGGTSSVFCSFVSDFTSSCLCDERVVRSHCPITCDGCAEYGCADSEADFFTPKGTAASCAFLASLDPGTVSSYCTAIPDLSLTCRATCGVC